MSDHTKSAVRALERIDKLPYLGDALESVGHAFLLTQEAQAHAAIAQAEALELIADRLDEVHA